MEKKGVSYQTLIIILTLAILVSVIVGIFVGAKVIKKETKEEEKLPEITITQDELDTIAKFMDYRGNITSAKARLEFVDYYLMRNDIAKDGNEYQYAYVTKDLYQKTYKDIYGDNYKFDDDVKNSDVTSMVYNTKCEGFEGSNREFVCWNPTWGITGENVTMKQEDTKTTKDSFTVTGRYVIISYDVDGKEKEDETGKFTIEYTIKNDNKYLKSYEFKKQ